MLWYELRKFKNPWTFKNVKNTRLDELFSEWFHEIKKFYKKQNSIQLSQNFPGLS